METPPQRASTTTRLSQSLASPGSQSQMSPDMAEPTPDARPGGQASLDPEITAALTELASRLEQRGLRAKVYVHDGMMSTMTHRDGDTTSRAPTSRCRGLLDSVR